MADVYTRIGYIKGATGATGAQGAKGDTGDAATIAVGTVTTVPYGQTANVVNSGTSGAAVFDFTIPQGKPGEQTTDMQNLTLGSITTSSASFPVPAVGETGKVLWGKVVKWFSDMAALVASKFNASNVVNNLTTTASGYALDARQGKALKDSIDITRKALTYTTASSSPTDLEIVTAIRGAMMSNNLFGFVGVARNTVNGSTWPVCITFHESYNGGSIMRIAYGGAQLYKYRYNNNEWTRDSFNATSSGPV